jgi:hypothetical protein
VRHARLVMGFAGGCRRARRKHGERGDCAQWRRQGKTLSKRRIAQTSIESPLRRRGEVRGSSVTCGGVEEAIAEERDARRNGTGPVRGEGLGRKIVMVRLGAWTRTRRWMWAGRGGHRGRDQLVVRSVRILRAFGPLRRHIVVCGRRRRMCGGSPKVLRERRRRMGGEGRSTRRWREHGGEMDGGGAVETVSEGRSRAWEPEGGAGERETTYLGLSTGGRVSRSSGARIVH